VLAELLEREFSSAGQVLVVNTRAPAPAHALRVSEVSEGETPAQGFDGALWECQGDPLLGLRCLRRRVRPSGLLLLSLRRRTPAWERLRRAFAGGGQEQLTTLEALCAAPLLAGLEDPRVLMESPELAVVAARVPAVPDALDDFFG
jgi:hypothetical protein